MFLWKWKTILLEYQAGVHGFRTVKFDMRVSESTVLILNEIAACANLGSLMLDIQAVVSAWIMYIMPWYHTKVSNLRNMCDVLKEMKSDFIRLPDRSLRPWNHEIRYKKIGNRSYNIKINSRVGSPVEPHVEDASCCIDMNNIYYDLILYDSIVRTDAMVWTGPEFQKNCRTENTERRLYDEIHINWVR